MVAGYSAFQIQPPQAPAVPKPFLGNMKSLIIAFPSLSASMQPPILATQNRSLLWLSVVRVP